MHDLILKLRPMAALLAAVFLVVGLVACGGGGEEAAPADDAASSDAPADTPAAAPAADYEPGNEAVAALRTGSATVSGTVSYDGEVPTLPAIQMAADPACQAKHSEPVYPDTLELGDGNTMAHIFVSVKGMDGEYQAPSEPAVIDQDGCRYHPHVMGVMAGQPLVFLNSDELLHNVHGLPEANREFNLGMPATRTEAEVTGLNTPEPLFPVKCDVHPWMQSYVAVMTHPYFDVTATDGAFEIDGLPPGTYEIEAWHERLGTQTQSVTVADGESASADFTFSR